jgi:hypothetical protein
MEPLRAIIRRIIKLASLLDRTIKGEMFLPSLTDDAELNYALFFHFAHTCSSNMLGVLYQLGYFCNDARIILIAAETLEFRRCLNHEEDDVGGHIENLRTRQYESKYLSLFFISWKF